MARRTTLDDSTAGARGGWIVKVADAVWSTVADDDTIAESDSETLAERDAVYRDGVRRTLLLGAWLRLAVTLAIVSDRVARSVGVGGGGAGVGTGVNGAGVGAGVGGMVSKPMVLEAETVADGVGGRVRLAVGVTVGRTDSDGLNVRDAVTSAVIVARRVRDRVAVRVGGTIVCDAVGAAEKE